MGSTESRALDPQLEHQALALDTLGDVLRACGETAFDTHRSESRNVRERAEQWARHLLLGAPHPLGQRHNSRDFLGARQFVRELRAHESEFVRTALSDFRSMLSAVFSNIERALLADGDADSQMRQQLARLHRAVQLSSIEQLRREVLEISGELSSVLTSREQRRSQELKELGSELKQLNERLAESRRTAETDGLTGVHNRRAFDAFLDRVVEFDGVTGTPVVLLMIDVDNFKILNDRYGHPVGDAALKLIAASLARTFLRKCDFVARYGGEEFAIVVRDANDQEARRLGERARAAIAALKLESHPEISLSVSVGVANLRHLEARETWLKRADDALLRAKQLGKNCCVMARD
jgi:diguanylate cyclase